VNARVVYSLGLCAALLTLSCSGPSTPPPPAASPTPGETSAGLQPLTSRGGGPVAPAAGPVGSGDATGALPAGHPPIEGMAAAPGPSTSSASPVSGTIDLSPELANSVGAGDVLYVMAKKDGTTLAVRRVDAPSFPYAFEVSEGHAMVAGMAFEGPVDIVARLSKTGDAIPSAGDLEGTTGGVQVPSTGVAVTIDRTRQ
jgi:cytochrome c-type biogenesis protein CcmH